MPPLRDSLVTVKKLFTSLRLTSDETEREVEKEERETDREREREKEKDLDNASSGDEAKKCTKERKEGYHFFHSSFFSFLFSTPDEPFLDLIIISFLLPTDCLSSSSLSGTVGKGRMKGRRE